MVLEILNEVVDKKDEEVLYLLGQNINYRIDQKEGLKRCYLEMSSEVCNDEIINAFRTIDGAITKSPMQKYFYCIKDYDGVSAIYCEKLYLMFGEFERKLRKLVLLVLTKAYGAAWRKETISDETFNTIKSIAQDNVSLSTTLENMDLNMLEIYLFHDREENYRNILATQFSKERLGEMSKEDICILIENMRPTSLWNKHFNELGTATSWQNKIEKIHKYRNKVAHHKTITTEEYIWVWNKISQLITDLNSAIEEINKKNFTEKNSLEIITDFIVMLKENMVCMLETELKKKMEKNMMMRLQQYAEFLKISENFCVESR